MGEEHGELAARLEPLWKAILAEQHQGKKTRLNREGKGGFV